MMHRFSAAQQKLPPRPFHKAHCLWNNGDTPKTMCGVEGVTVTPDAFVVLEHRYGYAYACRHCIRNLDRLVGSLTKFGVAMRPGR